MQHEEDAPAAVHMWRPHHDGTWRLMMRNELLTNKTMYPIGRIALDLEHLRMFEMLQILRQLPTEVTIHGCINDCFKVTGIDEKDAEDCCRKLLYADKTPVFKVKQEQPLRLCVNGSTLAFILGLAVGVQTTRSLKMDR